MIDDLIYDVGMNNGDDTAYYLHRGYRVVAIDADPQACEKARLRFQDDVNRGRLTIVNVGIAAEPGNWDFWICEPHSEWSSFDRRIASRDGSPHHGIQVPCRTFDSILSTYGVPYYLKADIEGHDLQCVDGLRTASSRPKYVSVEIDDIDASLRTMTDLGYTSFKCISQFTFVPLQLPPTAAQERAQFWHWVLTQRSLPLRVIRKAVGRPGRRWLDSQYTRTRRHDGWVFNSGSSGPFGEDTLGTWLTAEQVRDAYHHYSRLRDQGKSSIFWNAAGYSLWADLHARRDGESLVNPLRIGYPDAP
jgi:FkbM family methyltransferase